MKSMTGFGKAKIETNKYEIETILKSVNSRFVDFKFSAPKIIIEYENEFKKLITSSLKRGKIDIKVFITFLEKPKLELNKNVIHSISKLYKELAFEVGYSKEIPIREYINYPNIIIEEKNEDNDSLKQSIIDCIKIAIENHQKMALDEGKEMQEAIQNSLLKITESLTIIQIAIPIFKQELRHKLDTALAEFIELPNASMEKRILTELAFYIERKDINEEVIRLQSHINKSNELLSLTTPVGKSFNFVLQEMQREITTIGSKFSHKSTFKNILIIKEEVEKIREMIQNVE